MMFNDIINNILEENNLSRSERINMLKQSPDLLTWDLIDNDLRNTVEEIVRGVCTIELDRYGGRRKIAERSNPVVLEQSGDKSDGSKKIALTLPFKTIDSLTPENILRDWQFKGRFGGYGEYEDLDIDSIDFENFNFEEYGVELSDLYSEEFRYKRGVYLDDVKDIGDGYGRFIVSISWYDDV